MTAPAAPRDPRDELHDHLAALRAFAISLTRNMTEADDLLQDTIVKAWSNFDRFQPGTDLRAWQFTILRNTFYSERRKKRREVTDPDGIHAQSLFEKPGHDGRLAQLLKLENGEHILGGEAATTFAVMSRSGTQAA